MFLPKDSIKIFAKPRVLTRRDHVLHLALVALIFLKSTPLKPIIRLGGATHTVFRNCQKIHIDGYSSIGLIRVAAALAFLSMSIFVPHVAKIAKTVQEIFNAIITIPQSLEKRDIDVSRECFLKISRKVLYLIVLFWGGPQLTIISKTYYIVTLAFLMEQNIRQGQGLENSGKLILGAIRLTHSLDKYRIIRQ